MKPLSESEKASLEHAALTYQLFLPEAMEYLEGRGISLATAEDHRLGVVEEPIAGHEHLKGRLCIPSLGAHSHVYSLRFRSLNPEGGPKYMGLHGETRLFNLRAVHSAGDVIAITEGEIDAITLTEIGVPAVGVCGANNWKRHHPIVFAGFEKVYVFGDGDQPGRDFSKRVCDSINNGISVSIGAGEDVNSLFVKHGPEAVLKLMEEAG